MEKGNAWILFWITTELYEVASQEFLSVPIDDKYASILRESAGWRGKQETFQISNWVFHSTFGKFDNLSN